MSFYTEGDYEAVLRGRQKLSLDPYSHDLNIFLLDFYAYDEYRLNKHFGNDQSGDFNNNEPSYEEMAEAEQNYSYSDDEDEPKQRSPKKPKKENNFKVRLFGILELNNQHYTISVDVLNFKPFFYMKIPETWTQEDLQLFIESDLLPATRADPNVQFNYGQYLKSYEIVKAKPFTEFTADDQFQYAKLTFENSSGFRNFSRLIWSKIKDDPTYWGGYQLFESNVEPILRLFHVKELTPSGWFRIPKGKATIPDLETSDCQAHVEVDYNELCVLKDKTEIPPIICASYDIEADSSHGDFPIAKKNYQKLAQDIVSSFLRLPQKNEHQLRGIINCWLQLAFNDNYDNNNINPVVLKASPDPEVLDHLVPCILELGEAYAYTIRSKQMSEDIKKQHLARSVLELHYLLGSLLPEPDYSNRKTGHYMLLAEQLIKEVERMIRINQVQFRKNPEAMVRFWLDLAFDPYYDNHELNRVYTKHNVKPNQSVLENLIPQVYDICQRCYQQLNQKKEVKKKSTTTTTKKFKPPPPGQRRLVMKRKDGSVIPERAKVEEEEETDADKAKEERKLRAEIILKHDRQKDLYRRGRLQRTLPEGKITRDFYVTWMTDLLDANLPSVEGDPCIQIGTTFKRYGDSELILKHIIVLNKCSNFTNRDLIDDENDDMYVEDPKEACDEAVRLELDTPLVGQIKARLKKAKEENIKEPEIPELDELNKMLNIARKERQLSNDKAVLRIECYETEKECLIAWQRLMKDVDPDIITGYNLFGFDFKFLWDRADELRCLEEFRNLGRIKYWPERLVDKELKSSGLGENKLQYIELTGRVTVDLLKVVQTTQRLPIYKLDYVCNKFLYKRKNDMPPDQLFIKQKGSNDDRALIARYCLVDCILCNRLLDKLEIITNNAGMSQVCTVPLSYLFLRGQGIKLLSFVAKYCNREGYLIKAKDPDGIRNDEGYEGAIVLDPYKDIYLDERVGVCDFNSLYPSCMIECNLSQDSFVERGGKYDNLPGCQYRDVEYDLYKEYPIPGKKTKEKRKCGVRVCRFYQPPDGKKSLIPRILMELLAARKATRKEQKKFAKGTFEWRVKEGLQLAYKVTANSLYGQLGAPTSHIFFKDIAACTTARGRELIYHTRDFFESHYPNALAVYGDTDSVFIKFDTRNSRGEKLYGLDSVYKTIELCTEGALAISRGLKYPHNLEFEKAIWPFMLVSKKRYHGHYYTQYANAGFYANSMGIVLKRRDNAQIVKHIFGKTLDIIFNNHDLESAFKFCQEETKKLLEGVFPMDKFVITKTLKSYYKMPHQVAHWNLAQRIGERDPGNKPQSNDRMAFAYIKVPDPPKGEKVLQGDRIETPEYIKDHNVQLDYRFYLTNQVMKPVLQIFELKKDEVNLADLFMGPLMEYDRRMSGTRDIKQWVHKGSEEYKARFRREFDEIMALVEKDNRSKGDVKVEKGDEVYGNWSPLVDE